MKKHTGFIIFFTFLICLFFWKVLLLRGAFLGGDYGAQFYPWSSIYSESIKNLIFPYWTRFFHSGFPLMAEGQVGGFYPFNMMFFYLLPFRIAYNYIVVFHFVLAGLFTYFYTRKIGACQWGGALAALLFCFGSAYAGCFYNTVTVKTLIWVPLVLWFMEEYFERKRIGYIVGSGIVLGIQFLAGFAQLALYSAAFYAVYYFYGLWVRKELRMKDVLVISGALLISILMFYPQLRLSWPLASLSGRADASLSFALWGSFSPMNFMSTVIPFWIFDGTRFYIGIFSLLFLITAGYKMRDEKKLRPLFAVLLLSFFLGIGKYNPLYVLVLKMFHLYSFRNPSKFLFFGMFAASVLSGYGLTLFFSAKADGIRTSALKFFRWFIGIMLALFLSAKILLHVFGNKIVEIGQWYVSNFIYGKAHHRQDLESYVSRVVDFYSTLVRYSSFKNFFIIVSVILCIGSIIAAGYFKKRERVKPVYRGVAIFVILVDIFIFSFYGTGFRGNIKSFDILNPDNPVLIDIVRRDDSEYRILPYDLASGKIPNWATPNLNAIYGIDSVGAYTPLAVGNYKKKLGRMEVVDDSLGLLKPSAGVLSDNIDMIRAMNVKYVVSAEELNMDALIKRGEDSGIFLYEVKDVMGRGFVTKDLSRPERIPEAKVDIREYRSGYAHFLAEMPLNGFFVFSELHYPTWQATVDGNRVEVQNFMDILMAIPLEAGKHSIIFKYVPETE